MAIGHFFDGSSTGVFGTHTHVPTGDAQILEGGTADVRGGLRRRGVVLLVGTDARRRGRLNVRVGHRVAVGAIAEGGRHVRRRRLRHLRVIRLVLPDARRRRRLNVRAALLRRARKRRVDGAREAVLNPTPSSIS